MRYGLKFGGQLTDWNAFVEATNDEAAANRMAELGLQRARTLGKRGQAVGSPAARAGGHGPGRCSSTALALMVRTLCAS